jgi:hypothetical protein
VKTNNALLVPEDTPFATCMKKMDTKMFDNLKALFYVAYYIAKSNKPFSVFSELLEMAIKLGVELCKQYNTEKDAKTLSHR